MIAVKHPTASGGFALEAADGASGAVRPGDDDRVYSWGPDGARLAAKLAPAEGVETSEPDALHAIMTTDPPAEAIRGRRTGSPEYRQRAEEQRRRHVTRTGGGDDVQAVLRMQRGATSADAERGADEVRQTIYGTDPAASEATADAERRIARTPGAVADDTASKVADAERRLSRTAGAASDRDDDADAIADGVRATVGGPAACRPPGRPLRHRRRLRRARAGTPPPVAPCATARGPRATSRPRWRPGAWTPCAGWPRARARRTATRSGTRSTGTPASRASSTPRRCAAW